MNCPFCQDDDCTHEADYLEAFQHSNKMWEDAKIDVKFTQEDNEKYYKEKKRKDGEFIKLINRVDN